MLHFSVLWMLKYSIRWRPPMLGLRCSCQDCGAHAKIEVLMPRLRCSCQDCGAHAKIAVLMPRLRCSCQDWGAHAEIEVLKSPQSWPEHRNLGMSTSNSAWAPQSKHSNYLCIWGRHHQLDYLTRPRKSSWATNYPITACDLIFSFPGLWLFLRYSHIWKSSLPAWTQVFFGSPIFYPVLLVCLSVVWIFLHLTKSGCVVAYSYWETGGDSFTEDILWSVPKTSKSTFARKKLVFEVSDKNRAPD